MRCAPLRPLVDLTANVEVTDPEYATDGAAIVPAKHNPGFSNGLKLDVLISKDRALKIRTSGGVFT